MPLYEYHCESCGQRFEVIQKFSDAPVEVCRACGEGPVRRLASSPAIHFKGAGWYVTDYARKGKTDGTDKTAAGSSGSSDTTAKSDTGSGGAAEKSSATDTKSGDTKKKPAAKPAKTGPPIS